MRPLDDTRPGVLWRWTSIWRGPPLWALMCLSDDRLRGGALTLIPYAIEDGGRTSRQGQQAWLRQLADVRAAASGRVRLGRHDPGSLAHHPGPRPGHASHGLITATQSHMSMAVWQPHLESGMQSFRSAKKQK